MEQQAPETSQGRQGTRQQVHARLDQVFRRKNLELAWEKVKKNRGRAGIDEVTSAAFAERPEASLDLLHRRLRDGTYQPKPVKRVEIAQSEGGVRKLGIPAVLARVCQQTLVQRLGPIFEPTFLDSSFGYRPGRSPHDAMRQVWQELNAGYGWIVEADLRQFFDPIDQEKRIDVIAEESREGRVLQRVRDMLRAGVRAGGCWKPTRTGVPQGGGASPLWSKIFLTPFDRQMTAEGVRLTRWADDFVVRCRTREEAQRAMASAERFLREALGGGLHPQKTRLVHGSQGVEFLGYKVKQGAGHRLPAHKRRGRANPDNRSAIPREKSVQRFKDQRRALTSRKAPLTRREVIERINPVIRGWGTFDRKADVRRLFPRLDGWIEHRIHAFLAQRGRKGRWRRYPPPAADRGVRPGATDPSHSRSRLSMTPGWRSGGKRRAGKLHEPFERADGGRAA